jgi:hypothetical protein
MTISRIDVVKLIVPPLIDHLFPPKCSVGVILSPHTSLEYEYESVLSDESRNVVRCDYRKFSPDRNTWAFELIELSWQYQLLCQLPFQSLGDESENKLVIKVQKLTIIGWVTTVAII